MFAKLLFESTFSWCFEKVNEILLLACWFCATLWLLNQFIPVYYHDPKPSYQWGVYDWCQSHNQSVQDPCFWIDVCVRDDCFGFDVVNLTCCLCLIINKTQCLLLHREIYQRNETHWQTCKPFTSGTISVWMNDVCLLNTCEQWTCVCGSV